MGPLVVQAEFLLRRNHRPRLRPIAFPNLVLPFYLDYYYCCSVVLHQETDFAWKKLEPHHAPTLDLEIMIFWKSVFRYGCFLELVVAVAAEGVAYDDEGDNLVVAVAFDSDDRNKPVAAAVAYDIVAVVARNIVVACDQLDILPEARRDDEAVLACMAVQNYHLARALNNTCSTDVVVVVVAVEEADPSRASPAKIPMTFQRLLLSFLPLAVVLVYCLSAAVAVGEHWHLMGQSPSEEPSPAPQNPPPLLPAEKFRSPCSK